MSNKDFENLLGCILVGLIITGVIIFIPVYWTGLTYLTIAVFYGFGYTLNFWPTLGALILIHLLLSPIGASLYRSK